MTWTKAVAILVAVSVLAYPAAGGTSLVSAGSDAYASREAQAPDLEGFSGGWHGFVLTVLVVALLVWLIVELVDHHEIEVHHHHPQPARP